jgi:trigger factor
MQYDLQIENVSSIKRKLRFTIAQDVIKGELDLAFKDLKRNARLPGFRKGKVPRRILEARFGSQVRSDISSRLIDRSWREASTSLELAGQPRLREPGDVNQQKDFIFTIEVDVKPNVEINNYRGVEVPYRVLNITDEEVDADISRQLATRASIQEVTEDRPVQSGDQVLAELVLTEGDEELAREAGTMINTSNERFYPGIESFLIGMSKDDDKSGEVTIADSTIFDHLKGKTLQATAKVLSIQAMATPELTDELAAELNFEGGAMGMRVAVQMKLQSDREAAARNQSRVDLLQVLVDKNEFDVPDGMVEEQLQALVEELCVRRAYGGTDPRSIKFSDAEIADLRTRATFAAKASCILAAVSRQEKIEVGDADLDSRISEIAAMRGQAVEAIRGYLEREGAFDVLRDRILEEKTLEWLLENADLKEVAAETPAVTDEDAQGADDDESASSDSDAAEE